MATALALEASSRAQSGGEFSLLSSCLSGGGSTSSGGGFSITGSAGQHDAGRMVGLNFAIEGGFWHGMQLLQAPGGPQLKLRIVGVNAVISWPLSAVGYQLQSCPDLHAKTWASERVTIVDNADEHTVTLPAQGVVKFFRLKKP
jgi:hypothetical protein